MVLRIFFLVIAGLGLLAALGVVLTRNLVRAAIYLVGFFFSVACVYLILEADFLAAVQVLVYIGAVVILLLFGIMLTRNIQGDETTTSTPIARLTSAVAALALLLVLIVGIRGQTGPGSRLPWSSVVERPVRPAGDALAASPRSPARQIGIEMMTRYVVAFEMAGLLLTAAVIGAIALALDDPEEDPSSPASSTRARTQTDLDPTDPTATQPVPEPALSGTRPSP